VDRTGPVGRPADTRYAGRMTGLIFRLVITAFGLWIATAIVPGVSATSPGALFWAALWLGIVNAVVRPVLIVLTLPFTLITLGGFLLVINAAMLGLVSWLLDGFAVSGFFPALVGSIVVSLTSWLAAAFVGSNGRYDLLVVRRR